MNQNKDDIRLSMTPPVFIDFGVVPYAESYHNMLAVVTQADKKGGIADSKTDNQFWFLQHPPVFTQGIRAHQDNVGNHIRGIKVVKTDRGGLITYHGPGQLTIYALCHLHSKNVRRFVDFLEQVVIDILSVYGIKGERRSGMPGVYVNKDKIASIGLRIKNGMSYHGISLNVDMDLTPFTYINPCGYEGLAMTQMAMFDKTITIDAVTATAKSIISSRIDVTI